MNLVKEYILNGFRLFKAETLTNNDVADNALSISKINGLQAALDNGGTPNAVTQNGLEAGSIPMASLDAQILEKSLLKQTDSKITFNKPNPEHYDFDINGSFNATTAYKNGVDLVDTNDSRLSNARTPTAHTHAESDITNLTTDLAARAKKATITISSTGSSMIALNHNLGTDKCLVFVYNNSLHTVGLCDLRAGDWVTGSPAANTTTNYTTVYGISIGINVTFFIIGF